MPRIFAILINAVLLKPKQTIISPTRDCAVRKSIFARNQISLAANSLKFNAEFWVKILEIKQCSYSNAQT